MPIFSALRCSRPTSAAAPCTSGSSRTLSEEIMAVAEVLLTEAAKKAGGKIVKLVLGAEAAVALAATAVLVKVADAAYEETAEEARKAIGCKHIKVCPSGWGTSVSSMMDFAFDNR